MLKRTLSLACSRSSSACSAQPQQLLSACSYYTSQNLLDVRRVSVKPTTSSNTSSSSVAAASTSSSSSYKKASVSTSEKPVSTSQDPNTFQIRGSVNSVHLIGTIAGDAVTKELSNGGTFTGFTVVTSEKFKKGENIEEQSLFHSVVSFNPILGKVAGKFFKKGVLISVRGALKYREIEKDGVKQVVAQVVVDDFNDAKVIYGKYNKD